MVVLLGEIYTDTLSVVTRYVSILFVSLLSLNVILGVGGGGIVSCFGHANPQCSAGSLVQEADGYQGCADAELHIHSEQDKECCSFGVRLRTADVAALVLPGAKPGVASSFEGARAVAVADSSNENHWRTHPCTMRDDPGGEQRLTLVRSTRLLL